MGMTQMSRWSLFFKNLLLPVYAAVKINHRGETVVMPIYCHCDQNTFSSTAVAPASKTEAKLQVVKDSINNANGKIPGVVRRFHAIPADMKQRIAEITYAIV